MHRGHRHTDCRADTWTVPWTEWTVWTIYREALGKYTHTHAGPYQGGILGSKKDTLIWTQSQTQLGRWAHIDGILAGQSFIVSLAAILILEGLDKTNRLVMNTFTFNFSIFTVGPSPLKGYIR